MEEVKKNLETKEDPSVGNCGFVYELEPRTFPANVSTRLISSANLGVTISNVMRSLTDDYAGCVIKPVNNVVACYFYFQHNEYRDNAKFKAVIPMDDPNNTVSMIDRYNERIRNTRNWQLTKAAKSVLRDFIPFRNYSNNNPLFNNNKEIIWKDCYTEFASHNAYGNGANNVFGIVPVDLTKILSKLYGGKNADGTWDQFTVTILRNMNNQVFDANGTNYVLKIDKFDSKITNDLAREMGIFPTNNYMGLIMPTI